MHDLRRPVRLRRVGQDGITSSEGAAEIWVVSGLKPRYSMLLAVCSLGCRVMYS
jgi:hypothetical protein